MIVDDEEFCIASLKAMMKRAGVDTVHQVDFCITGAEAVELLSEGLEAGLQYLLIFTDFNMPEMDGIEATKNMRNLLNLKGITKA